MIALLIHVIVAISSVAFSSYLFFKPSNKNFKISYGLIALTLISGTYLVVATHSALLPACEAGLTYLVVVSVLIFAAQRRWLKNLAKDNKKIDQ